MKKALATLVLLLTLIALVGCPPEPGVDGIDGADGVDGTNCWDRNQNGTNDPDEDTNVDGSFDTLDCQGADGETGSQGEPGQDAESSVVFTLDELRTAIADLGPEGGLITVAPGDYTVEEPIVVDQDDIVIQGSGTATRWSLADGAQCPVLVIGDAANANPARVVRNVTIRDVYIDGNHENQNSELCIVPGREYLRNNCISIRASVDTTVENVTLVNARSGGIVTELGCENLLLRRIISEGHFFDGIAAYETVNSLIMECTSRNNTAAGLSLDIQFNNNIIADSIFLDNGAVGLFLRDGGHNIFASCMFNDNAEDGVFLADGDGPGNLPAINNFFSDCFFIGNGRFGLWQAGANSTGNSINGGLFDSNAMGAVEESFELEAPVDQFDVTIIPAN